MRLSNHCFYTARCGIRTKWPSGRRTSLYSKDSCWINPLLWFKNNFIDLRERNRSFILFSLIFKTIYENFKTEFDLSIFLYLNQSVRVIFFTKIIIANCYNRPIHWPIHSIGQLEKLPKFQEKGSKCTVGGNLWVSLQQYRKVGCVFPMVTWSEFRMGQHRADDHREDAPNFINYPFISENNYFLNFFNSSTITWLFYWVRYCIFLRSQNFFQ